MKIKAVHAAFTLAAVIGALYVWHMYRSHGTGKTFLSGLGVNR